MNNQTLSSIAWVAVALLLGNGCGTSEFVPAAGKVLFDGQPLSRGNVLLLPQSKSGQPAAALTDEAGHFEVSTGNAPGALPGDYTVVIVKDEPTGSEVPLTPFMPRTEEQSGKTSVTPGAENKVTTRFPLRSLIPEVYGNPERTTLRCSVPIAGTDTLLFELRAAN